MVKRHKYTAPEFTEFNAEVEALYIKKLKFKKIDITIELLIIVMHANY